MKMKKYQKGGVVAKPAAKPVAKAPTKAAPAPKKEFAFKDLGKTPVQKLRDQGREMQKNGGKTVKKIKSQTRK
jgi:hypothetical protein